MAAESPSGLTWTVVRGTMGVAGGMYVVGSDCPISVQGRTTSPFYEQPSIEKREIRGAPSFLPNSYLPLSLFFSPLTSAAHFFLVLAQVPLCRWGNMFFYAISLRLASSFVLSSASSSSTSRNQENEILCAQFFFPSLIFQILRACKCLLPTVTRSLSGEEL